MKVGDLVQFKKSVQFPGHPNGSFGLVLSIDGSHRQKTVDLFLNSRKRIRVWVQCLEVVSDIA
jgi:hypothetical protein